MKKSIKKIFATVVSAAMLSTIGAGISASAAEETTTPADEGIILLEVGNTITPRIHYDYDIPDFSLSRGETAYTTRYGYGFDVSTEGLNHNDFDITFYATGSSVNITLAVLTLEDYINGNFNSYVQSKTVTGAGSKTVNFYNLSYGTYVIKWCNNSSSSVSISNANLSTSY